MIRLLRLESAALAALAIGLYWHGGASWWLFAALILAPDLSFIGYLRGPKVGARASAFRPLRAARPRSSHGCRR